LATLSQILESAKSQLSAVTGLKSETVTTASKKENGWLVGVELLEMSRIPPATDVIGCYEVQVNDEGEVTGFERRRTRLRGEPLEETS